MEKEIPQKNKHFRNRASRPAHCKICSSQRYRAARELALQHCGSDLHRLGRWLSWQWRHQCCVSHNHYRFGIFDDDRQRRRCVFKP